MTEVSQNFTCISEGITKVQSHAQLLNAAFHNSFSSSVELISNCQCFNEQRNGENMIRTEGVKKQAWKATDFLQRQPSFVSGQLSSSASAGAVSVV